MVCLMFLAINYYAGKIEISDNPADFKGDYKKNVNSALILHL